MAAADVVATAAPAALCEQQWFWEKLHNACATQALALNMELPTSPTAAGQVQATQSPTKMPAGKKNPMARQKPRGLTQSASTPALGESPKASPKSQRPEGAKPPSPSASGTSPKGGRPRPRLGATKEPKAAAQQAEELFNRFSSEGFSKKSLDDFQKAIQKGGALQPQTIAPLPLSKPGKLNGSSSMPCLDSEASTRAGSTISTARSMAQPTPAAVGAAC